MSKVAQFIFLKNILTRVELILFIIAIISFFSLEFLNLYLSNILLKAIIISCLTTILLNISNRVNIYIEKMKYFGYWLTINCDENGNYLYQQSYYKISNDDDLYTFKFKKISVNLTTEVGFIYINRNNLKEGDMIEKFDEICYETQLKIAPFRKYKIYFEEIKENKEKIKLIQIMNSKDLEKIKLVKTDKNSKEIKEIEKEREIRIDDLIQHSAHIL